jgi:hypothetical protein
VISFYDGLSGSAKFFLCCVIFLLLYSVACEVFIGFDSSVAEQMVTKTVTNTALSFYVSNFVLVWLLTSFLFVLGNFRAFVISFRSSDSLLYQFSISSSSVLILLILSLVFLGRIPNADNGHYTVLLGIFSVLSVSIGWLINVQMTRKHQENSNIIARELREKDALAAQEHQEASENTARHNHRRSHTLNIILSQRLSREYHENVENVSEVYPLTNGRISCDDVRKYLTRHNVAGIDAPEEVLEDKKVKAIRSSLFLLDLYEFICEGIAQGDLDGDVIYESIGGTFLRNKERSHHLISAIRKGTHSTAVPKGFIRFMECTEAWQARHKAEESNLLIALEK